MTNKHKEASKLLLDFIRNEADRQGISQEELGRRVGIIMEKDLPVKQEAISRIFANKYSPSLDMFLALCESVNCFVFLSQKDNENDKTVELMKNRLGQNNKN